VVTAVLADYQNTSRRAHNHSDCEIPESLFLCFDGSIDPLHSPVPALLVPDAGVVIVGFLFTFRGYTDESFSIAALRHRYDDCRAFYRLPC